MFSRLLFIALAAIAASAAPLQECGSCDPKPSTCADVTVFFAKGTCETIPEGIFTGPAFHKDLSSAAEGHKLSLDFVDIPYFAQPIGYLQGGDSEGSKMMAEYVTKKANECPNSKLFITGYSQGAQVTHNAADLLTKEVVPRVIGAVTFGDPYQHKAFPSPIVNKVYCNEGDNICDGGILTLPPHFTYALDTPDAAKWILSHV